MKKLLSFALISVFMLNLQAQNKMNLDTEIKKVSYSLGVTIGNNLKNNNLEAIDLTIFNEGLKTVFQEKNPEINQHDADSIIGTYLQSIKMKQSGLNLEKGKAFLAENKKKKGVIETTSGLQYEVIKMGTGAKPVATDKVKTHYHGTLLNGKVFDSSVERGQPIEFPLNGVIAGWTEGLQLMPEGSKFRFYIPSNLAYGERGAGASIGPNETLIFDVELINIVK